MALLRWLLQPTDGLLMNLNSHVCLVVQLYHVCTGSSVHSGDIRFAMLVGTGLAFCNDSLTAKFDIIDLVLPPLSEPGRQQLLEQSELPGGELPSGAIQRALDQDPTLQYLCDGTLGIPGVFKMLGAAATAHFNNGHELGRYALILKHLHAQGPCRVLEPYCPRVLGQRLCGCILLLLQVPQ